VCMYHVPVIECRESVHKHRAHVLHHVSMCLYVPMCMLLLCLYINAKQYDTYT